MEVTGLHRKHAMRILQQKPPPQSTVRPERRIYTEPIGRVPAIDAAFDVEQVIKPLIALAHRIITRDYHRSSALGSSQAVQTLRWASLAQGGNRTVPTVIKTFGQNKAFRNQGGQSKLSPPNIPLN